MKLKQLLLFICVAGTFASCKKSGDDFDAEAQFTADTTAIRSYVTTNNIPVIKHQSGIFYQIITPGTGTVIYNDNTEISADYSGRLLGASTTFNDTKGQPILFTLGGLITGWKIGIPLIQKGGKIRLFLPSYYGYGNVSQNGIPANAILDFTIAIANVK